MAFFINPLSALSLGSMLLFHAIMIYHATLFPLINEENAIYGGFVITRFQGCWFIPTSVRSFA